VLLATAAPAADTLYELHGQLSPEAQASVSLFGVASPFTVTTLSEMSGKFVLKKLRPGAYTLAVFDPASGEARQTIEIGPAKADGRNRVFLTIDLKDSDFVVEGALRGYHGVSAKRLSVPDRAERDYEDAEKDLARHDVAAATQHLEHAVALAPQFSAAWNHLGTIAYQTQKYERAGECFREALRQDPGAYEPLVNLGGVLINLHRINEAWEYNLLAVLTRPKDPLANAQFGMVYFEMGSFDLAEKYFVTARRLDAAHFSHPQLFLAEIHLKRGDRHAAASDLEDFLQHHPDWPQAPAMREKIAELRGD
jgi:Tfp pilus assembly protein PilF